MCICKFSLRPFTPRYTFKKALGDEKSEDFFNTSFFKKAGISDEKSEDKKARIKNDF